MAFRPRDQECVCDVYPQTERDVSEVEALKYLARRAPTDQECVCGDPQTERDVSEVAALKYELAVQEPVEARLARAKASEARQMEAREAREAH